MSSRKHGIINLTDYKLLISKNVTSFSFKIQLIHKKGVDNFDIRFRSFVFYALK